MGKISEQLRFCPASPEVVGNVDYQREKELLIRMDELLVKSGIEGMFVRESMVQWKESSAGANSNAKLERRREELSVVALRSMILMEVIDESYRGISRRLAQCPLFQCLRP